MITVDRSIELIGQGLYLVLVISTLLIFPGLITGILISIIQATTQINEQTLSFLPRLLVTLLVIAISGKWIIMKLQDLFYLVFVNAAKWMG